MEHNQPSQQRIDIVSAKKSKLGVALFIVYSVVYAGFVIIGVTNYTLMSKILIGGQNLAVLYGFGLIILAIVLGLVYNTICTRYESKLTKEELS